MSHCVSTAEQVCVCSARRGMSHCGVEGIYRGEAECESVMLTVLTVGEGCRLLGHREHPINVCVHCSYRCIAFHHHPSVSRGT